VTSPYGVSLLAGPPVQCLNKSFLQHGCYIIQNIMLDEKVLNVATMIDYFNTTTENALFHVKCINCRLKKVFHRDLLTLENQKPSASSLEMK